MGLTPTQKAKIAIRRFAPLKMGQNMTNLDILANEYGSDIRAVTNAIKQAFQDGLVRISEVDSLDPPTDFVLEQRLVEKYQDLRNAVVIADNSSHQHEKIDINKTLGLAIARRIQRSLGFFLDDVTIGVGTSRSISHMVAELARSPLVRVNTVRLISLTGSVFPNRGYGDGDRHQVDADAIALQFLTHFQGPASVAFVHRDIASSDIHPDILRGTVLHPDEYAKSVPGIIFAGLGVLGPHHRLFEELELPEQNRTIALSPIYDLLAELRNKIADLNDHLIKKEIEPHDFVCDFCNRLFVIPTKDEYVTDDANKTLIGLYDLVNEINNHMVTVTKTQINLSPQVVLIAGGLEKAEAIRYILSTRRAKVTTLCTDASVASRLLERPKR